MHPVNERLNNIVFLCLARTKKAMSLDNEITVSYSSDETKVPSTGKAIHAMWEQAKVGECTFVVYSGANDSSNLYFSPQVNLLYRTVHDFDHALNYKVSRGTTKYKDELYLNCLMAKRVYDWTLCSDYYTEQDALLAFFAMYHDTVGQVQYYKEHGDFVVNQRQNTVDLIDNCKGYKAALAGQLHLAYQVMQACLHECGV